MLMILLKLKLYIPLLEHKVPSCSKYCAVEALVLHTGAGSPEHCLALVCGSCGKVTVHL